METEEIWKDVPGYKGYYMVSNHGRVRSLYRVVPHGSGWTTVKEKILKNLIYNTGYPVVYLSKDGILKMVLVHSLVAISFLNYVPDGRKMDVDHINGIRSDPRLENLRIVTHRFNCTFGERVNKDRLSSKHPGVSWYNKKNKWKASIKVDGKSKNLGCFVNEMDASSAYMSALSKLVNQ